MRKCLDAFTPYLILGFGIAFVIGLMYIIAHVVIGGLIIAALLWGYSYVKQNFFSRWQQDTTAKVYRKHKGIIIEHDDLR